MLNLFLQLAMKQTISNQKQKKLHDGNKMTTKLKWKESKKCRVPNFSNVEEGADEDTSNLFLQPWTWNSHKKN